MQSKIDGATERMAQMETTLAQLSEEKHGTEQLLRSALSRVDAAERERDLVSHATDLQWGDHVGRMRLRSDPFLPRLVSLPQMLLQKEQAVEAGVRAKRQVKQRMEEQLRSVEVRLSLIT